MKIYFLPILLLLITNIFTEEPVNDDGDDYIKSLDEATCAETPALSCRSTELHNGRQCCEIFEKNGDEIQESCEMKTTREEQDLIVGSSRIINKELGGISIYNEKYGGTIGES